MELAVSARQQRWRERTDLKRVEVYLPSKIADQLDLLTKKRGLSRAKVIAQLVERDNLEGDSQG